jgi:hypothetical protein
MVQYLGPLWTVRKLLVRFLRSNFVAASISDRLLLIFDCKLCKGDTYILIQCHLPKWPHRIISMRPNLRHIKDVKSIRLRILWLHDLHIYRPAWIFFPLDCFVEISLVVVGVFACHLCGGGIGVVFDTLIRFEVDFNVVEGAVLEFG